MSLQLGPLSIPSGVLQSPMAGCTDLAFRLLAREKGLECALTEMVSARALLYDNPGTLELMETGEGDRPVGAQLVGCEPDVMAEAASKVEAMGFDLLDLNLGCPVRKIVQGGAGAGAALLLRPEEAGRIFERVVKAVKRIPVTVKTRLGFADPSGEQAIELGKRAQDAGIQAITIHGRSQSQTYGQKADYEAIGRVKRALRIPVIGNGDVFTGTDAVRLVETSGCDGVMIGRGSFGNPWIYKEAEAALRREPLPPPPTPEEKLATLLRHLELELKLIGEHKTVLHMRRIACWYVAGLPGKAEFRDKLHRVQGSQELRSLVEAFRDALPKGSPEPALNS